MTKTVLWTTLAARDLEQIQDYIAQDNPEAAYALAVKIQESVDRRLPEFPESGRPGRVTETRELSIPGTPYIVPYRIKKDKIEILAIYHSARRWPDRF